MIVMRGLINMIASRTHKTWYQDYRHVIDGHFHDKQVLPFSEVERSIPREISMINSEAYDSYDSYDSYDNKTPLNTDIDNK